MVMAWVYYTYVCPDNVVETLRICCPDDNTTTRCHATRIHGDTRTSSDHHTCRDPRQGLFVRSVHRQDPHRRLLKNHFKLDRLKRSLNLELFWKHFTGLRERIPLIDLLAAQYVFRCGLPEQLHYNDAWQKRPLLNGTRPFCTEVSFF